MRWWSPSISLLIITSSSPPPRSRCKALQQLLLNRAQRDPNTMVVIKADEGVSHGRVVSVMDLARNQGLTRLAIATEVEE